MKKIYAFLALCLLSIVPMSAVVYYHPAGITMERMYPSVDFATDTPFLLGNPREHIGTTNPWGGRTYLSPSGMKGYAKENSLYVFVATGENDKWGTPTYLLKNVSTGQYLSTNRDITKYTASAAQAQTFTVMPAVYYEAQENGGKYTFDWTSVEYDVRNSTVDIDTNNFYPIIPEFKEGVEKSFIICLSGTNGPNDDLSKGYFLNSPTTGMIREWQDTNSWVLFSPEEVEGIDALEYAYWDLLGAKDFIPEDFPIGDGPGLYSEEALVEAVNAWDVFSEYLNYGTGTDEECEEAIQNLDKALTELYNSMGSLKDGQYYRFWNSRSVAVSGNTDYLFKSPVYDAGGSLKWTAGYEAPEVLDVEASKYVWQLKVINGKNYFQNYYTKRWMGDVNSKSQLPTTVDPTTDWRIEDASDLVPGAFRIRGNQSNESEKWSLNTNCNNMTVGYWQSTSDKGSLWKVETMDPEQLAALDEQIAQDARNTELKSLVEKAESTYAKGISYTQYLTSVDQLTSNAVSENSGDGTLADCVDRNFATLYHTNWRTDGDLGQPHWIQVELPEPLSDFTIDVVRRKDGNDRGAVTTWGVAGTNDAAQASQDIFVSEDLNATLAGYQDWDVYQTVSGKYDQTYDDNGTLYKGYKASFDVKLPKPCKYIRLLGLVRYRDYFVKDTLETGEVVDSLVYASGTTPKNNVYFNMAELIIRSTEVDQSISLINAVPQEVQNALLEAIEKAKLEVEGNNATQTTLDQLQEAYDEFLNKFPDPESLKKAVADAKALAESAPTGTEAGYFPEGSTDDLNRVISQVEATIKDVMSADDVNAGKEELSNAIEALQEKVILPEEGVYFLRNIQDNGDGTESERYAASFHTGENTLRWGDNVLYDCSDSPCYYWLLTKEEGNTFSLRSYGTNNYLYAQVNSRGGDVVAGPEKSVVKLRMAQDSQKFIPGQFAIMLDDTYGLNFESTGRLVAWNPDARTAVEFVEPFDDWSGDYTITYEAGKPQIITLPYALNNDSSEPLLKLIGTFNNAFQFEEYADDEVIPAGTPVLYYSDDDNYTTDAFSLFTDDLEELTYTTEAKTQNGMVGTLVAIKELPIGCGIFYGNKAIGSVEGEGVEANTGYLLTDVETDHVGDYSIPYDENVKSLEEGIQNAVVINNKASRGTFNLMGQKMQGKLPAGLYIVNGKKLLVK